MLRRSAHSPRLVAALRLLLKLLTLVRVLSRLLQFWLAVQRAVVGVYVREWWPLNRSQYVRLYASGSVSQAVE